MTGLPLAATRQGSVSRCWIGDINAVPRIVQVTRSPAASRLTAILLVALAGCSKSPPSGPAGGPPPPALTVVHPQKKMLPRVIEQPGTVRAYEETPLYAKLAAYVIAVRVDIGDTVDGPSSSAPGTVLAELSIPELEDEGRQKDALVEQAAAEVEQAKEMVTIAQAGVETAGAQIVEAKAGVSRAQANLARWKSEAVRVGEMVRTKSLDPQTGAETENQLRAAEAAADEARARVTVAEKAAVKARAELGKAREDVKAVDAKRKVAAADAARTRSLLDYRFIRAPFAGVVTRRTVDTGHFVQPVGGAKAEALFTVVRLDTVRVPVEVPEADAAVVHKGQKAVVKIPVLNASIEGKVSRTAEALEPGSRTLRVEVDLPNADHRLRPGMYVTAQISAEMPETWVVPANAIVKQAEQVVCFLYRDGKAVRLAIQPGRSDGKFTEVFKKAGPGGTWEDWTGGEDVLSGPTGTLSDGQGVEIK
jgi:HlyD family secretion protein